MPAGGASEHRILVVEDSPTQATHRRLVLEDAGYGVEVVANGREGLERAIMAPPQLIISEIVMLRAKPAHEARG